MATCDEMPEYFFGLNGDGETFPWDAPGWTDNYEWEAPLRSLNRTLDHYCKNTVKLAEPYVGQGEIVFLVPSARGGTNTFKLSLEFDDDGELLYASELKTDRFEQRKTGKSLAEIQEGFTANVYRVLARDGFSVLEAQ